MRNDSQLKVGDIVRSLKDKEIGTVIYISRNKIKVQHKYSQSEISSEKPVTYFYSLVHSHSLLIDHIDELLKPVFKP